jgi:hypothetical protein
MAIGASKEEVNGLNKAEYAEPGLIIYYFCVHLVILFVLFERFLFSQVHRVVDLSLTEADLRLT